MKLASDGSSGERGQDQAVDACVRYFDVAGSALRAIRHRSRGYNCVQAWRYARDFELSLLIHVTSQNHRVRIMSAKHHHSVCAGRETRYRPADPRGVGAHEEELHRRFLSWL